MHMFTHTQPLSCLVCHRVITAYHIFVMLMLVRVHIMASELVCVFFWCVRHVVSAAGNICRLLSNLWRTHSAEFMKLAVLSARPNTHTEGLQVCVKVCVRRGESLKLWTDRQCLIYFLFLFRNYLCSSPYTLSFTLFLSYVCVFYYCN